MLKAYFVLKIYIHLCSNFLELERIKKTLVWVLLFVLGLGTFGSFAAGLFVETNSGSSFHYDSSHQKLHVEKLILAFAEVEEVEEELDDEDHSGLVFLDLPHRLVFIFHRNFSEFSLDGIPSVERFVSHKTPIYYLFRNIRI
jgi:hypothetical protein